MNGIKRTGQELLADLNGLTGYLKSEVRVGSVEEVTVTRSSGTTRSFLAVPVEIAVKNEAPKAESGSKVVFTGVGLGIAHDTDKDNLPRWARREIRISRSDPPEEKPTKLYIRQDGQKFPDVTSGERRLGNVLFPGQVITYQMKLPIDDLARVSFQVEGNLSRRHLFRREEVLQLPKV